MTYRARRLAKAERLRDWADKREAKAEASRETVDRISDVMQGQPILVGHHSEKRHGNQLNRMFNKMHQGVEDQHKADEFRSRADNIEAAADHAIYSDDPDAIVQLEKRIAYLEAQRAEMKAANAAYREEHKAELARMTHMQKDDALPYASWAVSNLSANINRNKKRLAELRGQS